MYTLFMHTNDQLQKLTDQLWEEYCEVFPKLVRYNPPRIVLNNRFTKCAGCCYTEENSIAIASKFMAKFPRNMVRVILPHEIAHQIDYNLNGWYARKQHHGIKWVEIMVKIGQPAEPYHRMVL